MNKKLTLVIGMQALCIIALFWVLIFYSKDEYEAYQHRHDDEIVTHNRVSEKDGVRIVSLSAVTQQNSGITTAKLLSSSFAANTKSMGTVIALDGLIEAKANYLKLQSEIALARAASGNNSQQYQRLKALNEDEKNVSDKVVQDALAAVNADKANISAAQLQLSNLQSTIKLQWGKTLSGLVFGNKLAPYLANLLNRSNVLVQVSLPPESPTPSVGAAVNINYPNATNAIKAYYVSPAAQTDANGYGKTFYYSAPAESLRIGMRVNVQTLAATDATGAVIPNNAVVWYGGKAWAYFKLGNEQFVRKPITTDTELENGWFNANVNLNAEVVVSGAQLLLSEEFKSLIKNENDD